MVSHTERTSRTNSRCWTWHAETFTEMRIGGRPSICQRRLCAHASRKIHSPSRTMTPPSSAMGMNSVGDTGPIPGQSQRMSASAPTIRPERSETIGWYTTPMRRSAIAWRRLHSRLARRAFALSSSSNRAPAGCRCARPRQRGVGAPGQLRDVARVAEDPELTVGVATNSPSPLAKGRSNAAMTCLASESGTRGWCGARETSSANMSSP